MIEEKAKNVQKFQTDDWREALAFFLIVFRKSAEIGEEVDAEIFDGVYELLTLANERGWDFTAEQTIGFCIDDRTCIDRVEQLPLALEAGGFLRGNDFDKIFAEERG